MTQINYFFKKIDWIETKNVLREKKITKYFLFFDENVELSQAIKKDKSTQKTAATNVVFTPHKWQKSELKSMPKGKLNYFHSCLAFPYLLFQ